MIEIVPHRRPIGGPIVATDAQFGVGSILSSPLVVGETVYFGTTAGNLYALE